jgi:ammonium transporter, Amt family
MDFSHHWYLVAAGISFLIPAGLVLLGAAGMSPQRAWDAALGGLAAICLAGFGYWATGFALHFGGVGLFYPDPQLESLVSEWSALPIGWGTGWGMAGLSGWFLATETVTPAIYSLFLAHLPWAVTAAMLPVLALRGRAPAIATLLLALLTGGVFYPLAGNWVQGGGWLAALGNNLALGHGLIDFGGAGTVFAVAAGITFAALLIWLPRSAPRSLFDPTLPPVHLPLLAVVGALLLLIGVLGWNWANPIQMAALEPLAQLRGSVNALLFAVGGGIVPLLYTWFVTGESDPSMTARGVAAGTIAGFAAGPFVPPAAAFFVGLLAGATVPFVTFALNRMLRLNDSAGVVVMAGIPALIGLLSVGIFADGLMGSGWQRTGIESHLDVAGQGVSGIFVASGLQMDFPGQFQAQLIGALTLVLWGFITGTLVCAPLAVLFHGVELATAGHSARSTAGSSGNHAIAVNGQPAADNHHQRLQERLEREQMRQDASYTARSEPPRRPSSESTRRRTS